MLARIFVNQWGFLGSKAQMNRIKWHIRNGIVQPSLIKRKAQIPRTVALQLHFMYTTRHMGQQLSWYENNMKIQM